MSEDSSDEDSEKHGAKMYSMTPQQALALICTAEDWPSLFKYIEKASRYVDLDCLQEGRLQKLCDIPQNFFDRRYYYIRTYIIMNNNYNNVLLCV